MYIPNDKTFHGTKIFYLVILTLKFDLLLKNFNLGHNFQTRRDRVFLVTRPFKLYHNFRPHDLDLEVDKLVKNFNFGCYLMMVATWQASLSSDNSYCLQSLS